MKRERETRTDKQESRLIRKEIKGGSRCSDGAVEHGVNFLSNLPRSSDPNMTYCVLDVPQKPPEKPNIRPLLQRDPEVTFMCTGRRRCHSLCLQKYLLMLQKSNVCFGHFESY